MQVSIYLLSEAVNDNMRARSGLTLWKAVAIRDKWLPQRQQAFVGVVGVVCGALLLGLFGASAGAVWSMALGFGASIGALCGGLGEFVLGLVVVPLDARIGKAFSLGMAALAIFVIEMATGAIVWGMRAALG